MKKSIIIALLLSLNVSAGEKLDLQYKYKTSSIATAGVVAIGAVISIGGTLYAKKVAGYQIGNMRMGVGNTILIGKTLEFVVAETIAARSIITFGGIVSFGGSLSLISQSFSGLKKIDQAETLKAYRNLKSIVKANAKTEVTAPNEDYVAMLADLTCRNCTTEAEKKKFLNRILIGCEKIASDIISMTGPKGFKDLEESSELSFKANQEALFKVLEGNTSKENLRILNTLFTMAFVSKVKTN